jgi:hypothetical protein
MPGRGARKNKNSIGEMGSPCPLLLIILTGTEQVLPVITMAEELANSVLIILMKLEIRPISSKTEPIYDNSSLSK